MVWFGLALRCVRPLSTIFQLHRGGQFYWWRKLGCHGETTPTSRNKINWISSFYELRPSWFPVNSWSPCALFGIFIWRCRHFMLNRLDDHKNSGSLVSHCYYQNGYLLFQYFFLLYKLILPKASPPPLNN